MGYTHYYKVAPKFETEEFQIVVKDFEKLIAPLEHLGVKLGDECGEGSPVLRDDRIAFNGLEKCGHPKTGLTIPWPAKGARGVNNDGNSSVNGTWHGGHLLGKRECNGDCSYETFALEQQFDPMDWQEPKDGKYFCFTKTAFRPYDLAVTACLVIAKHHLGDDITISSDGSMDEWADAMELCQHFLGYGEEFSLDD